MSKASAAAKVYAHDYLARTKTPARDRHLETRIRLAFEAGYAQCLSDLHEDLTERFTKRSEDGDV